MRKTNAQRPASRKAALGFAMAFGLFVGVAVPVAAQVLHLTLEQSRVFARQALAAGDFALAHDLARGLLEADPNDPEALLVLAALAVRGPNPGAAVAPARQVFNQSTDPNLRFDAARVIAQAQAAQNRPAFAKYWLRRADDFAPTPALRRVNTAQYQAVDAADPWTRRLSFGAKPRGNLNGGARTDRLEIDGIPGFGTLSGDAMALSGVAASMSAQLAYRFSGSNQHASEIFANATVERAFLSDAARDQAPGFDAERLGQESLEVGVRTQRVLGANFGVLASLSGAKLFQGGDLARQDIVASSGLVYGGADGDPRYGVDVKLAKQFATSSVATKTMVRLSMDRDIGVGFLSGQIEATDHNSDAAFESYSAYNVMAAYAPKASILGAKLTYSAQISYRDYPSFVSGLYLVPGGRQDIGFDFAISARFENLSYMGFSPVADFSFSQQNSNVSRYDTRNIGLGLTLQSRF